MRSTVIATITSTAMTRRRRAAPPGGVVMSEAVVTAALFANLGGGVNAGLVAHVIGPAVTPGNETPGWLFSFMN